MNREAWLTKAAEEIIKLFNIPPRAPWRVTCGFPSKRGLSAKRKVLGECWDPSASSGSIIEIVVSMVEDDATEVLGILAHELLHAHLPENTGHRKPFPEMAANRLLLGGKPTATVVTPEFQEKILPILQELGEYPHDKITSNPKVKTQTTRMLKCECGTCGYSIRISRKWADMGTPDCPICHENMPLQNPDGI